MWLRDPDKAVATATTARSQLTSVIITALAQTRSLHPTGADRAAALAVGYHIAFTADTGLAAATIIVAAVVLRADEQLPAAPAMGQPTPRHDTPDRVPD
jgi:hypothetical protein